MTAYEKVSYNEWRRRVITRRNGFGNGRRGIVRAPTPDEEYDGYEENQYVSSVYQIPSYIMEDPIHPEEMEAYDRELEQDNRAWARGADMSELKVEVMKACKETVKDSKKRELIKRGYMKNE